MKVRTYVLVMILRQQTPVEIGFEVMGSVIAIVKQEEVEVLTAEIAGVIEFVVFITAIMLKVVRTNDAPCCVLMR